MAPILSSGLLGFRPEVPQDCEVEMQDLIRDCWHDDPARRPTIDQVMTRLISIEEKERVNYSELDDVSDAVADMFKAQQA